MNIMRNDTLQIRSRTKPARWEEAMLCGNGISGLMVMGGTHAETLIVCHEKCYIEYADYERQVSSIQKGVEEARVLAMQGEYRKAHDAIIASGMAELNRQYPGVKFAKDYLPCNGVHPACHLRLELPDSPESDYERLNRLDSGEVVTRWRDEHGRWERRCFASQPDQVLAVNLRNLDGARIPRAAFAFLPPPAMVPEDIAEVTVKHRIDELYYHCLYSRSAGKPVAEGYHVFAKVFSKGGSIKTNGGKVQVTDAAEITMLLRVEFLDTGTPPPRAALRQAVLGVDADYDRLLERHRLQHAEKLDRVTVQLGEPAGRVAEAEDILAASKERMTPELLQAMHAIGRNMFLSSSGELPPALMGIWSNDWDAPWGGRFTLDSNLNLAVASGNQGNMPEAMESFFGFIERMREDWRENARVLYGNRGFFSPLVQDWRTGKTGWFYYMWIGGPGWLYSYFWDHYQYTQDATFLKTRVIPALIEIAEFYEDHTDKMPRDAQGKRIFYPAVSPENLANNHKTSCLPNPSMDISICRQVLTNLIAGCGKLGLHEDKIPKWRAMLGELPAYRLLEDGALAEWSWPGIDGREEHRHASHLYAVYPGTEISGRLTPAMAKAARQAIQRRIDGGTACSTGHALMHHLFFCARLLDVETFWWFMDEFAKGGFLYSSLLTSHNPRVSDFNTFNLDICLSMPALVMEMLVYSEPGYIHLLPMAGDRLRKGSIRGVLARGGIRVEELEWDLDQGVIRGALTSKAPQSIEVYGPAGFAPVPGDGKQSWALLGKLTLDSQGRVPFECRAGKGFQSGGSSAIDDCDCR